MKFLSYLVALLGSLVGVVLGLFVAFPEESKNDIHFHLSEMHPALVVGIVVSGVVLALLYVFLEKKAKGFWLTLMVTSGAGLIYPIVLQFLFLFLFVFVVLPLFIMWYYKWITLMVGGGLFAWWWLTESPTAKRVRQR